MQNKGKNLSFTQNIIVILTVIVGFLYGNLLFPRDFS